MEPAPEEAGPAAEPQLQPQLSSPFRTRSRSSSLSKSPDLQPFPALGADTISIASIKSGTTPNAHKDTNPNPDPNPQSAASSTRSRPVSSVVPPYWRRHERDASRVSQSSLNHVAPITLEDHTADPNSETSRGLWARSVSIDDHVVVQGMTGVGSYVVWNCTIYTLDGAPIVVRMRYSEFDDLRQRLVASFPHARNALPALPPKSVLFKFRPKFLESRRVGLEYFLNCILLNPEFSGSPIVKDFLFGRIC
ncbi:hypothetical protein PENANT_c003G05735 [Penicillium antarcticum]|uniref:Endosomal/vacuolar adapter protein YPT35 n=1 Tax=Penicillium antarcticum TaxID=416450 RepID=A0A1V6QII1_9EURO|nr:uncharacterized protein N7508_005731 [Penicillium antarcticum]KAJ5306716.1 hypothetical protein N7508_005731 [Penicillium antarcticum]OQD88676.1 hypothetical protein PENANT_c003G05735 [Penicillium antarcticum]